MGGLQDDYLRDALCLDVHMSSSTRDCNGVFERVWFVLHGIQHCRYSALVFSI